MVGDGLCSIYMYIYAYMVSIETIARGYRDSETTHTLLGIASKYNIRIERPLRLQRLRDHLHTSTTYVYSTVNIFRDYACRDSDIPILKVFTATDAPKLDSDFKDFSMKF